MKVSLQPKGGKRWLEIVLDPFNIKAIQKSYPKSKWNRKIIKSGKPWDYLRIK